MNYAAESYAAALLEVLVHTAIAKVPRHHIWIRIEIPAEVSREELAPEQVPGWDAADWRASRAYGDAWYESTRSALLLVPSVVAREERMVVINQRHPEFSRLTASAPQAVIWDRRLFGRRG